MKEPSASVMLQYVMEPLFTVRMTCLFAHRDKAPTVIDPLITEQAIEFLFDNLTADQLKFYHSMGSAWITPK